MRERHSQPSSASWSERLEQAHHLHTQALRIYRLWAANRLRSKITDRVASLAKGWEATAIFDSRLTRCPELLHELLASRSPAQPVVNKLPADHEALGNAL